MAGISNVCEPLHLFGEQLPVWYTEDRRYWVESRTLSQLLGYVQVGSLRKQVLHDWTDELNKLDDYYLEHDGARIRDWEAGTQHILDAKPIKPARGLLFFSSSGLLKILGKSTKERASRLLHLFETGELNLYFPADVLGAPPPQQLQESSEMLPPLDTHEQLELDLEASEELEGPGIKEADRFFQYEVLQRLIGQLQELEIPALQVLAIEAAEIALDRNLGDLRQQLGFPLISSSSTLRPNHEHSGDPAAAAFFEDLVNIDIPDEEVIRLLEQEGTTPPPLVMSTPEGPRFTSPSYNSLSRIGAMAGGYSAKTAGVAADLVAKTYGFSHDDIRKKQLHINQLVMLPDRRGKPRQMYRFSRDFSNKVVLELRTNSALLPERPKAEGKPQPRNLSVGPFEDEPRPPKQSIL
jgi:hypothetical protein